MYVIFLRVKNYTEISAKPAYIYVCVCVYRSIYGLVMPYNLVTQFEVHRLESGMGLRCKLILFVTLRKFQKRYFPRRTNGPR